MFLGCRTETHGHGVGNEIWDLKNGHDRQDVTRLSIKINTIYLGLSLARPLGIRLPEPTPVITQARSFGSSLDLHDHFLLFFRGSIKKILTNILEIPKMND